MEKYNIEKVLYFANQRQGLHVQDKEENNTTDLWVLVSRSLKNGRITEVGRDDSGTYYKTTIKGRIALLEKQIEWRKNNGKCNKSQVKELEEITNSELSGGEPVNQQQLLTEALLALLNTDVNGHALQDRLQFTDKGRELLEQARKALESQNEVSQ